MREKRGYIAAGAMSLALVGLGVGIGALVWSGDSTPTSAPVVAGAAQGGGKGSGNYTRGATIHIQQGIGDSYATMHLSAGSDSQCTKSETVGDFPVRDGTSTVILMQVRSSITEGSCFYKASWHTWKVDLPGGGGELGVFEQSGGMYGAVTKWYEAQCQPHWTGGWSCRDDSKYGQAGSGEFWLTKTL
jgi:hypothetical protein